ncbi:MAG: hypothetical protein LBD45_02975 [Bacteroidales bacterium]|jgi:hypothetical protein|nr:hypothetical protein [Bacteroidales bacterium]
MKRFFSSKMSVIVGLVMTGMLHEQTFAVTGMFEHFSYLGITATNIQADYASALSGISADIDVLANDLGTCTRNNIASIRIDASQPFPYHGTAVIQSDKNLRYRPAAGWYGLDSVQYVVEDCFQMIDSGKVYILTHKPLSREYYACQNANVTLGFTPVAGVQYFWYDQPGGGSPIANGSNVDAIRITKDATAVQTLYAEARYGSITYPRIRVDLELSDNCGTTNPVGCAVNGRVIWKEDFDRYGNGLTSQSSNFSSEALPAGMTTYKFARTAAQNTGTTLYKDGYYALLKYGSSSNWTGDFQDDHTSWGNYATGRFFIANGKSTPDQVYKQTIDHLCAGTTLYLSFWVRGTDAELKWTVYSSTDNTVLATFTAQQLPPSMSNNPWKLYGFNFDIPENVTSIYFDIYNYNTKTGGNDFAVDDIEVRLCAPQVTINMPATNEARFCMGKSFSFTGSYIDNNTFGMNLVYQWEYSVDGTSGWSVIPGSNGSSSNGKLSVNYALPAHVTSEGYYRMVVSSPGNITNDNCRVLSRVIHLLPYPSKLLWTPGNNSQTSDAARRNWNDPNNWTPKNVPVSCSDVYISGTAETFPFLSGNKSDNHCNSIWFMQGGEVGQPQRLTYEKAFIQFNFGLQSSTQAKSNNITAAHLELSAGKSTTALGRNQWHMFSAPLHCMVSGDFAFGGFPLTFLRKFDITAPKSGIYNVGSWTGLYDSLIEPFNLGEGFIIWMNEYRNQEMYREHGDVDDGVFPHRDYGLRQINGILEFPYFDNPAMCTARRILRSETGNDGKVSDTFYYIGNESVNLAQVMSDTDTFVRTDRSAADSLRPYRFIVENYSGDWQFANPVSYSFSNNNTTCEILVGNPYMSTIDFREFYLTNSTKIMPQYRLWTGTQFATVASSNNGSTWTSNPSGVLDRYIAPMQSFFVVASASPAPVDLTFDVTKLSIARPKGAISRLRAPDEPERDILRITARNDNYSSSTLIGRLSNAHNGYLPGEDVYKLFSPNTNVPELFTVTDDYALEMNYINGREIQTVPLCIKTTKSGNIALIFTGMNNYNAQDIELIDVEKKRTINLTGMSDFSYQFDNQKQRVIDGRFFLRISQATTVIDNAGEQAEKITVYRSSTDIVVLSTANDPIRQITLYDIDGRQVYSNRPSGSATTLSVTIPENMPVVIVKAVTERNMKTEKIKALHD